MNRLLIFLLCAIAVASANETHSYVTGKLIEVNRTDSTRVTGQINEGTGQVATIEDSTYRITVEVGDMTYVGEYSPRWRWSYTPEGWTVNDSLQVRFDKKNMFIKRPDDKEGKELKTSIFKKIRKSAK